MMKAGLASAMLLLAVSCANRPPVIEAIAAHPDTVVQNGQSKIEAVASDPDNDVLRYCWTASAGFLSESTGDTVTWTAPKLVGGYDISLVVRDSKENTADTTVTITVISDGFKRVR